jgi:hypothetical protein
MNNGEVCYSQSKFACFSKTARLLEMALYVESFFVCSPLYVYFCQLRRFPSKEHRPADWERKMNTWIDIMNAYSKSATSLTFTVDQVANDLNVGGLRPVCLPDVVVCKQFVFMCAHLLFVNSTRAVNRLKWNVESLYRLQTP